MSNYTEEEQIAQFKDWWSRNGKPLMAGGLLAIVIVFGWQTWQKRVASEGQYMSGLYQQLLEASLTPGAADAARVLSLRNSLVEAKPNHAYTQYARLLVAKLAMDDDRLTDAENELREVLNAPANTVLRELAHQRLARVLAASGRAGDALALLNAEQAPAAYRSSRDELKGDVLVLLGRLDEARTSYEQARDAIEGDAGLLNLKLDDLSQKDT